MVIYFLYVADGRDIVEVSQEVFNKAINCAGSNLYPWEHMIPFVTEDKEMKTKYEKYWIMNEDEKVVCKIGMIFTDNLKGE